MDVLYDQNLNQNLKLYEVRRYGTKNKYGTKDTHRFSRLLGLGLINVWPYNRENTVDNFINTYCVEMVHGNLLILY